MDRNEMLALARESDAARREVERTNRAVIDYALAANVGFVEVDGRLEVQAESDDGPVCTGCGCDDASRLLMAAGEPTWLATALVVMFGMSDDDAREMVEMAWPDLVAYAYGRRTMLIRACASCADAASASFSDPVPVYSAARHARGEYAQLHGLVQSRTASGLEDVLRDVLGSEPEDE